MRSAIKIFSACLMLQVLWLPVSRAQEEISDDIVIRLANSVPFEGTFKSASPEGLTLQTAAGPKTIQWKYLSAGTRLRYEQPMLEKAKAAEEAKKRSEEARKKAIGTNAPAMTATVTNKAAAPATSDKKEAESTDAGKKSKSKAAKK